MRRNWIVWSVFLVLGVLLWVSSAGVASSRAFQMAVILASLCWSAYKVASPQRQ